MNEVNELGVIPKNKQRSVRQPEEVELYKSLVTKPDESRCYG